MVLKLPAWYQKRSHSNPPTRNPIYRSTSYLTYLFLAGFMWLKPGMPKFTRHHLGGAARWIFREYHLATSTTSGPGKQLILREYVRGIFMWFPVFLYLIIFMFILSYVLFHYLSLRVFFHTSLKKNTPLKTNISPENS